jgi:DNA-binding MarR family transcriptional regulator
VETLNGILRDINRQARIYRDQQLAPLGITSRHGMYLREVGASPGISQEQLAGRIGINKSNVARQVAALEEEGYLERRPCGKDKRVLRLYLTESAQALLPRINRVMDVWEQVLMEGFAEAERQSLESLLLRLRDNAVRAVEVNEP